MANAILASLINEFQQYGDNPQISADAVNRLHDVIVTLTGGAVNPPLDQLGNNHTYWMALALQVATSAGAGGISIAWTPTSLNLGNMLGFFTFGDLPGITSITFNQTSSIGGFDIESTNSITNLSWPNLTTVDPTNIQSGYIFIHGNAALTSVSFPKLQSTGSNLVNIGANPVLVSLDFSGLVPPNGSNYSLTGNAFNATSVNLVLHRAVLNAAYVSGTIDTSGGTSAAPTGQGIADKATLIARGVTVNTN